MLGASFLVMDKRLNKMNRQLLKKTLRHILKRYPIVLVVMVVIGIALVKTMGDPVRVIGLAIMGSIVGPALTAVFYYREQLKKKQQKNLSYANEPASRLLHVEQLRREGIGPSKSSPSQEEISTVNHQDENRAKDNTSMKIHPWLAIMVALGWPMIGFFLCLVVKMIFKIELSKLVRSIINLVIGCFGFFYLFPKIYRAPFGLVPVKEYLKRIGFYLPTGAWRHILLGIILAGCTLSGILVASLLTGRYEVNWSKINLSQIVFSLSPGFFEELFYRGIIVMLLLPLTKSLKKSLVLQIILFGLAHIKGFDLFAWIDVVSVVVIAVAFTYVAYKTRALLAGMVFHFLHDAFLFFVQVPDGVYNGLHENVVFYGILWLMVGAGCFIIWYATERLNIRGESELYSLGVG